MNDTTEPSQQGRRRHPLFEDLLDAVCDSYHRHNFKPNQEELARNLFKTLVRNLAYRDLERDSFIAGFMCAGGSAEDAKSQANQYESCLAAAGKPFQKPQDVSVPPPPPPPPPGRHIHSIFGFVKRKDIMPKEGVLASAKVGVRDENPVQYRLLHTAHGSLVLQGCYKETFPDSVEFVWKTIPTVREG